MLGTNRVRRRREPERLSIPIMHPFPTLEPIYFAYFSYGAAFLFLAFSIGTKNMEGSNLRIADRLWMLALFGVGQGLREFIKVYPLIEGEHLTPHEIFDIETITTFLLTVSYLFLLHFGLSLVHEDKRKRRRLTLLMYPFLVLASVAFLELEGITSTLSIARLVHIAARNVVGFAACLITGYGMIRYSSSREIRSLTYHISRNMYNAGLVFFVFALFTTTAFADFARILDVSNESFRAGSAVLIAFLIIRALNIFDVEIRRKAEKQARELVQAERLASLGKLAAGIAHEINNPLTNASLGIQIAKRKLGSGDHTVTADQLSAVEKSIDRAAVIAQELLQFSREERETEFSRVDINEVIQTAISQLKHRLTDIRIEPEMAAVPAVRGDRGKLEQVFINVLSNAIEAMPEGGVLFISSLVREDWVEAVICDTGPGIEPDILSKVFDPFFTTKEVGAGTGLGLYISYGIMNQHHGTIQISSEVGRGTTVTIKLPVAA